MELIIIEGIFALVIADIIVSFLIAVFCLGVIGCSVSSVYIRNKNPKKSKTLFKSVIFMLVAAVFLFRMKSSFESPTTSDSEVYYEVFSDVLIFLVPLCGLVWAVGFVVGLVAAITKEKYSVAILIMSDICLVFATVLNLL